MEKDAGAAHVYIDIETLFFIAAQIAQGAQAISNSIDWANLVI